MSDLFDEPVDPVVDGIADLLEGGKERSFESRVEIYNAVTSMLKEFLGLEHPVLAPQLVPVDLVEGNDYNPNKVAPPEMRLLHLSMKKDGVTMPVVAARNEQGEGYTVVDGFHRTTTIKTKKDVRESLRGYVPLVRLEKSVQDRITSTVRHNIARGTHQIELSAKLVTMLKKHNWSNARIGKELGMDADEVLRLRQTTGLAEAFADEEFSKSWE